MIGTLPSHNDKETSVSASVNETVPDYDGLCKWYVESGLYQSFQMTVDEIKLILRSIQLRFGLRFDCYCTGCRESSVFTCSSLVSSIENTLSTMKFRSGNSLSRWIEDHLCDITFTCARNGAHSLRAILLPDWFDSENGDVTVKLTKIGQSPSKLDLLQGALTRYSKVAEEVDLRELRSAALCHSHGLHVAAFAYLRRVFERRLEVAHQQARQDASWKEEDYDPRAMRMEDRIGALAAHLPRFLVENRVVYKILSRGIHELAEGECKAAYSAVDEAIGLILDEEIERREKSKRIERATKSLGQLGAMTGEK